MTQNFCPGLDKITFMITEILLSAFAYPNDRARNPENPYRLHAPCNLDGAGLNQRPFPGKASMRPVVFHDPAA